MKVLVVDDHPTNRKLLRVQLEGGGHQAADAEDGLHALERLRAQPFDAVITDILMPNLDGYGLCLEIRKDSKLRHLPLIIYTATYTSPADEKLAYDAGADLYLLKPAAPERILAGLEELARMRPRARPSGRSRKRQQQVMKEYSAQLILKVEEKSIALERANAGLLEKTAQLEKSEGRFRALIENASDGIWICDPAGRIRYASPAASRISGYRTDLLEAMDLPGLAHPEDLPTLRSAMDAIEGVLGEVRMVQCRIRHQDGSWRWLESTVTDATGIPGIEGWVINFRDITERKSAEDRLASQLRRLAALREIDLAIAASSDLQLTLTVLLEQVVSSLRVDAAAVLLFDPVSNGLRYAAQRGFRNNSWVGLTMRLGEGYSGIAALERRLVYVPDIGNDDPAILKIDLIQREGFVSLAATPLIAKGQLIGVLQVFLRASDDREPDWLDFFQTLAGQTAIAVDSARLFEELQRSNLELTLAYDRTIEGWSHALDLRDKETEGHTRRVTEMTLVLCRELGMDEGKLVHIRRGTLLHDIGKMGVPDQILLKPGPLTSEEWVQMQQHPRLALELLSSIEFLRPALDIPYCHHEKWDGSGYPRGLRGEEIPLSARIFAVVDVWDALTSDRPYRAAWSREDALAYIRERAGSHFDPKCVEVFMKTLEQAKGT